MALRSAEAFPIAQGYSAGPHRIPQQLHVQAAAAPAKHHFTVAQCNGRVCQPPTMGVAPELRVLAPDHVQVLPAAIATAAAACPQPPRQIVVQTLRPGNSSQAQATSTAAGSKSFPAAAAAAGAGAAPTAAPRIIKVAAPGVVAANAAAELARSGAQRGSEGAAYALPTQSSLSTVAASRPSAAASSRAIRAVPDPNGGPTRWVAPAAPPIRRSYLNSKAINMKYKFDGDFKIAGKPVLLEIDPPESERAHRATGLRVWDGGIVLARYMEQYAKEKAPAQLKALELGCGTGIAGFALAYLGHDVILSDLGELQQQSTEANIQRNAQQVSNGGGRICYKTLDWNKLPDRSSFGEFDVVFAGDVIWHETLVEPFLNALTWACAGPGTKDIVLSHKVRDEESVAIFEEMAAKRGLSIARKVVSEHLLGQEEGHPEVTIYHLAKTSN